MAYNWKEDTFYRKKSIRITWVMIWNGSTEMHWWRPEDYRGIRAYVDGKFQSIDWNNPKHLEEYFFQMKQAGIDVIASDLTNGLGWERQTQQLQKLCFEHGMKLCVAINHHGNVQEYAQAAERIWNVYADPDSVYGEAYFYKDGKPLIVNYCWYDDYQNILNSDTPYGNRFNNEWASGENARKDKWGWQVEPQTGVIPSKDTVFVTPSICYDSPRTGDHLWRRSLAWMDYGFMVAMQADPKHLIVGSYDDVHERNGWFVCDTRNAAYSWQMRDVNGAISTDVYYNRVKEWLQTGTAQPFFAGGSLRDGAYQIVNCEYDAFFAPCENRREQSPIRVKVFESELDSLYWFYHLGNDDYRIIKLNSGFSLELVNDRDGTPLRQNYDSESYCQRWKLVPNADGSYALVNRLHDKAMVLSRAGDVVTGTLEEGNPAQQWKIIPVKTL